MHVTVPNDVRNWIRGVFRACNGQVSSTIANMPTTHEAALDFAFVAKAAEFSAPVKFPSEWMVRIDTHFLGGRRHFYSWEVADIGVLIHFRQGGRLIKSKIALLQSKRLYAKEEVYDEEERVDYEIGFARLFRGDSSAEAIMAPRLFAFGDESRYQALKVGDEQYCAVASYEARYGIPVYYMLYHPPQVPFSTEIPRVPTTTTASALEVGTRVIPGVALRAELVSKPDGYSPYYQDLKSLEVEPAAVTKSSPGWVVEEFIADLALDCKVGHIAEKETDPGLFQIFNRHSGPIAAAIAVTFDGPAQSGG
jgi:hypothetical protein